MKALIVIDMQESYLNENRGTKRHPYDTASLVNHINRKIQDYASNGDDILYVKNCGKQLRPSPLVASLKIATEHCFEKNKASCFSNPSLIRHLAERQISEIELVGIDGNFCVGLSAADGARRGFTVHLPLSCVGIGNQSRFARTRENLMKLNVQISD